MRAPSDKQRAALELVQRADGEERHRAFWWGLLPKEEKARALIVAGLNKHRAGDPLETFTPAERTTIYGYLTSHITNMTIIAKLMGVSEVGAHRVGAGRAGLH